jgi:K+-sensing histidine kinase KdpD
MMPEVELKVHIAPEYLPILVRERVENACKFSAPSTAITICVEVREQHCVLTVFDNGRRMSNIELRSIAAFNQFEREKFEQQGLGIGLTIIEDIVKIFDGYMKIQSTSNKQRYNGTNWVAACLRADTS